MKLGLRAQRKHRDSEAIHHTMPVKMRAYIISLRLAHTPHPQTEEEEGIKHNKVGGHIQSRRHLGILSWFWGSCPDNYARTRLTTEERCTPQFDDRRKMYALTETDLVMIHTFPKLGYTKSDLLM